MLSKKVLASTLIYGKVPFETALDELKRLGFSLVEMALEPELCPHYNLVKATTETDYEIAKLLEERGMRVSALNIGDSMVRPMSMDEIKARHLSTIRLAKVLRVKKIVVAAGNIFREEDIPETQDRMIPYLNDLAAEAARNDIQLLIEAPHKLGITETPALTDAFWERMSSKAGLCFDAAHCIYGGGDPLKTAEKYAKRIGNLHLRDGVKGNTFVPYGTGGIDFQGIFNIMNANNYSGTYTIEFLAADIEQAEKVLLSAKEFFSGMII